MGRGEHPWKNHHKNIQIPEIQNQIPNRWIDTEFPSWNLNKIILGNVRRKSDILIFRK